MNFHKRLYRVVIIMLSFLSFTSCATVSVPYAPKAIKHGFPELRKLRIDLDDIQLRLINRIVSDYHLARIITIPSEDYLQKITVNDIYTFFEEYYNPRNGNVIKLDSDDNYYIRLEINNLKKEIITDRPYWETIDSTIVMLKNDNKIIGIMGAKYCSGINRKEGGCKSIGDSNYSKFFEKYTLNVLNKLKEFLNTAYCKRYKRYLKQQIRRLEIEIVIFERELNASHHLKYEYKYKYEYEYEYKYKLRKIMSLIYEILRREQHLNLYINTASIRKSIFDIQTKINNITNSYKYNF